MEIYKNKFDFCINTKRSHSSTIFDLAWYKSIYESFGHDIYVLKHRETILPLVHLKSILFGNHLVSVPFLNYGGFNTDELDDQLLLINEARKLMNDLDAEDVEIREDRKISLNLLWKKSKITVVLELPDTSNELYKKINKKLGRKIRRAQKAEMYFQIGIQELLNDFYTVFSEKMRNLGTPVYGKYWFKNILKNFNGKAKVCCVYSKTGDPAAASIIITNGEVVEIPWAASRKKYDYYNPNTFLYWNAIKFSIDNLNAKYFDFGRCTPGSGTHFFKKQWGGKEKQLYWYYILSKNKKEFPEINPRNPKYKLPIKIWKHFPLPIANFLGPFIVKNIPG